MNSIVIMPLNNRRNNPSLMMKAQAPSSLPILEKEKNTIKNKMTERKFTQSPTKQTLNTS